MSEAHGCVGSWQLLTLVSRPVAADTYNVRFVAAGMVEAAANVNWRSTTWRKRRVKRAGALMAVFRLLTQVLYETCECASATRCDFFPKKKIGGAFLGGIKKGS